MPVRSLTPSLPRGPEPEPVLNPVRLWVVQVAVEHPGLERLGLFGSDGRGDAGVGSDLDLLLIDSGSDGPQHQRLLACPWRSCRSAAMPWCSRPRSTPNCWPAAPP